MVPIAPNLRGAGVFQSRRDDLFIATNPKMIPFPKPGGKRKYRGVVVARCVLSLAFRCEGLVSSNPVGMTCL